MFQVTLLNIRVMCFKINLVRISLSAHLLECACCSWHYENGHCCEMLSVRVRCVHRRHHRKTKSGSMSCRSSGRRSCFWISVSTSHVGAAIGPRGRGRGKAEKRGDGRNDCDCDCDYEGECWVRHSCFLIPLAHFNFRFSCDPISPKCFPPNVFVHMHKMQWRTQDFVKGVFDIYI